MKYNEFKRYLESLGARFEKAKGSHMKVYLNDKMSIFPNHGSKEIGKGLVLKIKKDLGVKKWNLDTNYKKIQTIVF